MVDKLMSIAELADYLGISRHTIYQRRYRGDSLPPAIKVGGQLRYRHSDVARWLHEQTEPTPVAGRG